MSASIFCWKIKNYQRLRSHRWPQSRVVWLIKWIQILFQNFGSVHIRPKRYSFHGKIKLFPFLDTVAQKSAKLGRVCIVEQENEKVFIEFERTRKLIVDLVDTIEEHQKDGRLFTSAYTGHGKCTVLATGSKRVASLQPFSLDQSLEPVHSPAVWVENHLS